MKAVSFAFWFGITYWLSYSAVAADERFQQVETEEGPILEVVNAVHQDGYGFLWFGSSLGLMRFDGSRTLRYEHDEGDAESLSNSDVRAIYEDREGRFWIGTFQGLNLMDRRAGTFVRYLHDDQNSRSLSGDNVRVMYQDRRGRLWVGTDRGVDVLEDGEIERKWAVPGGVTALAEDEQEQMWIGSDGGLYRYEEEDGLFVADPMTAGRPIRALYRDDAGRLWAGTRNRGVVVYDVEGQLWRTFRNRADDAEGLLSDSIRTIVGDQTGRVWVGTESGLMVFDPDTEIWTSFQRQDQIERIQALFADWDQQLWVSVEGSGLYRIDLIAERFRHYELSGFGAWSVDQDPNGIMWLATKAGVARLDPADGEKSWCLGGLVVRSVRVVGDQVLVGLEDGLVRLSTSGDEVNRIFFGERIWRIEPAADHVWLGGEAGVSRLSPSTWTRESLSEDAGDILNTAIVSAMLPDGESLWFGAYGQGLFRYVDGAARHFPELTFSDITDLYRDGTGDLWIASLSAGLIRFSPETDRVEQFIEGEGFPTKTVAALAGDDSGAIWAHTPVGVVHFQPDDGTWRTYSEEDGVLTSTTIPGTRLRSRDGSIWFGGMGGLSGFDPDAFGEVVAAPIIFTSIRAGSRQTADLALPGENMVFSAADRTLSFDVALLDYRSPKRQRYGYQRVGLDDQWIDSERHPEVNYTSYLNYGGRGELRVRGVDANGAETQGVLYLEVTPPAWVRWAPLLILLALGLLVWLVYAIVSANERRKRAKLMAQKKIAEERAHIAEREREVEQRERRLQQERTRVLQEHLEQVSTEIANDLHDGPLGELHGLGFRLDALSADLAEASAGEELGRFAQETVPRICATLRNLCGELLSPDFEYGLAVELDNYADVVEGQTPGLQIERALTEENLPMSRERMAMVYRIYRTLLKNVAKHAETDRAEVHLQRIDSDLELIIVDDGKGFDPPKDWDNYKRNKHYGMYMANYFAINLEGELNVVSASGQGARIRLRAPLEPALATASI